MTQKSKQHFVIGLASIGIFSLGYPAALNAQTNADSVPATVQPARDENTLFNDLSQQADKLNELRNADSTQLKTWADKPTQIFSIDTLATQGSSLFDTARNEIKSGQTDQTLYNVLNSLSIYKAARTAREFLEQPAPHNGQHYDYCTIQKLNLNISAANDSAGQSNGTQPETLTSPAGLRTLAQDFVTNYQNATQNPAQITKMLQSVQNLTAAVQDLDFNYPGQKPAPQATRCPTP